MRLPVRILITLSVLLAVYMVLVFAALRVFVYPTFAELEDASAKSNVERVQASLDSEFERLGFIYGEYALWDDSYHFAQGINQAFADENLERSYLASIGLDVIVFFDSSGQPIWSDVLDAPNLDEPDPAATLSKLMPEPLTLPQQLVKRSTTDGQINGMLESANGLLMIVSGPILPSDEIGPPSGTLLVGSYLNHQKIEDISQATGVDIRFGEEQIVTIGKNSDYKTSYLPLIDVSNRPLGQLEVETPRDVMRAGLKTIYATAISLLAAGLLLLLAIWVSIRRNITNPVAELGRHINAIRKDDDLDRKLDLGRSDEIGRLARDFDAMTTALRDSRDELTHARDNAMQLAQHKSEFLATMSHEIRTPLNGVLGMTELLLSTGLDGRQKRFAHTAHQSGEMLLSVINDILDYSKIDSDKLVLDDADIDVREIIEDLGAMFAQSTQQKSLELVCTTVPPDMPCHYRGDAVRIRQILSNLLSNAVKFTEAGEITLTASPLDEQSPQSGIRFVVRDTGIGIEAEALEGIFDSFSQADRSTTRRFGGTGLGLAIARQLTRLIGGDISVTSTPGQGSVFTIDLNLKRLDRIGPTGRTGALRNIAGARILIVDDNETNREVLRHQVQSWNMEAHSATNARDALSMIDQASQSGRPFDLAILDLHMPEMDGSELAHKIHERSESEQLSMVMLSSVDLSYRQHDDLRPIISSFLMKPVRQSVLFDAIAKALVGNAIAIAPSAASPVEPLLHRKILLAEDNAVNREVACEMLRQLNCSIDIATNGAQAAELVRKSTYDIVLMDCNMPVADGFEATRRIRLDDRNQALPIVALTANALEGDRERCLAAGMDDYISKPFTLEQLAKMLELWSPSGSTPAIPDSGMGTDEATASAIQADAIATIRGMQRDGQPDLLTKLVNLYLDSSAEDVRQLRQALSEQDSSQIKNAAHSLKSSSVNLGARNLAALCETLEKMARAGELNGANDHVTNISSEHVRVVDALRQEVDRS